MLHVFAVSLGCMFSPCLSELSLCFDGPSSYDVIIAIKINFKNRKLRFHYNLTLVNVEFFNIFLCFSVVVFPHVVEVFYYCSLIIFMFM